MILSALLLLQAAAAAPAGEAEARAEALGARLARAGSVMALLPLVAAKDTDAMIAEHPELSEAERTALRATAQRTLAGGLTRIETAFGRAYAKQLTLAELRTLVAQAETPAAQRQRAVMPAVMTEALGTIGELDFKKDTMAAFCRDTGKLCAKK